jgi:hypothetical protein
MSDLAALMQHAPITAAGMIGQQNLSQLDTADVERQRLKELIQKLQLENQMSQQENPLLLEKQRLGNQKMSEVDIPQGREDLQKSRYANTYTGATQPGQIGVANSKATLDTAQNETGVQRLTQDKVARLAMSVDGVPGPLKSQALRSALQESGLSPQDPQVRQMLGQLQQVHPDKWSAYLKTQANNIGQYEAYQSPTYQGTATTAASHMYAADQHRAGQENSARIAADAKRDVQKAKNAMKSVGDEFLQNAAKNISKGGDAAISSGVMLAKMEMQAAKDTDDPAVAQQHMQRAKMFATIASTAEKAKLARAQAIGAGKNGVTPEGQITQQPAPTSQVEAELGHLLGDAGGAQVAPPKLGTPQNPIKLK